MLWGSLLRSRPLFCGHAVTAVTVTKIVSKLLEINKIEDTESELDL